ncbi:PadR family transcriptional regulator [Paenibacillus eucommiae]|uniref:DNA-binding PadR family transcriptional regulator n=1 Tax=Paenibacillus eucommiae TaxID=1355755 RepID=A0ABS4J7P9_9BACL|nr:PadR family transcriptional regulator [Paenibacillus eucommiae]MBP1995873.1 DNA-binding PadR family transcriptional regulator [Paenibacillus eucommiae]
MNTLSYGLLSLLNKSPRSGYELMQQIQLFWPARHSQIYPLLAKLQEAGSVEFIIVPQSDKPDKKVYSITQAGKNLLREWISQPTADPINRDELMIKIFCISLTNLNQAELLLSQRECYYRNKLLFLNEKIERISLLAGAPLESLSMHNPSFGSYMLVKKAILNTESNLEWCKWAAMMLRNS